MPHRAPSAPRPAGGDGGRACGLGAGGDAPTVAVMPRKEARTAAAVACEDRIVLLEQDARKMNFPDNVLDDAITELETFLAVLESSKKPRDARDAARRKADWRSRGSLDDYAARHGIARGALERFARDVDDAYRFVENAWRAAR